MHDAFVLKRTVTRDVIRVAIATAAILLVPLVAMQFTDEVAWNGVDFAVAGILLAGTGCVYVVFTRNTSQVRHRILIGLALTVALLVVWMELAVGIFGTPFAGS